MIKNPVRLRRRESFLGVHFDFHAGKDCVEIGKNVTPEMVEYIIETVKPDYIQCDCKGHNGFSSYPTKVAYPAPGFKKDQLRIWRDVTAKHGVALYMHYSGVWDNEALKHHPDWACVDKDGNRDKQMTSVFGDYVDKLLIPQVKELIDIYDVDGIWLDGECWATKLDYSEKATYKFQQETGISIVSKKSSDPHFFEYMEFCREGFRKYIQHYVSELHKYKPGFQICSNWAYSARMPEPVNTDVDFLSGDYAMIDSLNSARMEARCLVYQGKPWDLMSWGFTCSVSDEGMAGCSSIKSVLQLQQEAAVTIALGGGFQVYFKQKRDGSISQWQMKIMKKVSEFCRARQKICHKATPVPQMALLHSTQAFYHNRMSPFFRWNQELKHISFALSGILHSLLASQNVVDIVSEHHLTGKMSAYPLIVVPECEYLDEDFKQELLNYVESGGNLLLIGPAATSLFGEQLNVSFKGQAEKKENWLEYEGRLCGLKTTSREVELKDIVSEFGKLYLENDIVGESTPAASITDYGKGKIAGVYVNIGECYFHAATSVSRNFLNGLVRELFPESIVEVKGSHSVDVILNRIESKLAVNLINTSGPHGDPNVLVFDEIPETGPLTVSIRVPEVPSNVSIEPGNRQVDYTYNDGKIELTLHSLKIHDIIVVEWT